MNIPIWNYIRLTDPITLPAGQTAAQTPACPWTAVPANLVAHPCVRVLILPESLTDAVWSETFIRSLTSIPDSGDPNGKDLAGLISAYGVPYSQTAQMNIEWSAVPVACPPAASCLPCADGQLQGQIRGGPRPPVNAPPAGPIHLQSLPEKPRSVIRPVAYQPPSRAAARPNAVAAPPSLNHPQNAAVINFQAMGITPLRRGRRYTFFQMLGGVTKVVDLGYLNQRGDIPLHFNVSNSKDVPRSIFLTTQIILPPGVPAIGVQITPFPYAFGKGETKAITVSVRPNAGLTPYPPPPPVGGGPCPCPPGWGPVYVQPVGPPTGGRPLLRRRSPRIIYSEPVISGSN